MARNGEEEKRGGKKSNKKNWNPQHQWPPIKPKSHLRSTLLKSDHLFTVENFFRGAESKAFVQVAESMGFRQQGSLGPSKGEAFRDNDRISVEDPLLAHAIWESGLHSLFHNIRVHGKVAVGLNPNIRFYRYKVGQRFGRHIDESVDLGGGRTTQYTLLIYLTGSLMSKTKNELSTNMASSGQSLVGGETVFYNHRGGVVAEVAPVEGMALLHIHGYNCMLHEARAVTKNVKPFELFVDEGIDIFEILYNEGILSVEETFISRLLRLTIELVFSDIKTG